MRKHPAGTRDGGRMGLEFSEKGRSMDVKGFDGCGVSAGSVLVETTEGEMALNEVVVTNPSKNTSQGSSGNDQPRHIKWTVIGENKFSKNQLQLIDRAYQLIVDENLIDD